LERCGVTLNRGVACTGGGGIVVVGLVGSLLGFRHSDSIPFELGISVLVIRLALGRSGVVRHDRRGWHRLRRGVEICVKGGLELRVQKMDVLQSKGVFKMKAKNKLAIQSGFA